MKRVFVLFATFLISSALVLARADVERGAPLPRKGAFGAQLAPLSQDEAKKHGPGVKIVRALPELTAAKLGLTEGDIVTSVAGQPVATPGALGLAIRDAKAGDPLSVEFLRGEKKQTAKANLVERPKQKPDGFEVVYDQVLSKGKRIRVIGTHPAGTGKYPTVFLIGGIGAYSVDGDFGGVAYGNIMGPIAKAGYATIRIDKPGQGDSEGPIYTELSFLTELDAYLQAIRLAKTLPFVDPNRIVIFGHSMGGCFGPLVGKEEKIAGVIASGTLTRTWGEYMLENTRRQSLLAGASFAQVDTELKSLAAINHYLFSEGLTPDEIAKKRPDLAGAVAAVSPDRKTYSGVGIPFFKELADQNLAEAWAKTDAKVLTLWGANEFISGRSDHELIVTIVNKERPGTATFQVVPDSDHGFFKTSSQEDSFRQWGKGAPFNPNVVDIVLAWLKTTIGDKP
ncbi:MAG TPA: alpha/beta fold hydrolase [Fimbriimonadaceae bacterium]|nr:alpha/beta fold hydrolase [Fimbriimonadaceae bacterium]